MCRLFVVCVSLFMPINNFTFSCIVAIRITVPTGFTEMHICEMEVKKKIHGLISDWIGIFCEQQIFKSAHRSSIVFRHGLWLGHSNMQRCSGLKSPIAAVAECFGLLTCLDDFAAFYSFFFSYYSDCLSSIFPWTLTILFLLRKLLPTSWCCQQHVSRCLTVSG